MSTGQELSSFSSVTHCIDKATLAIGRLIRAEERTAEFYKALCYATKAVDDLEDQVHKHTKHVDPGMAQHWRSVTSDYRRAIRLCAPTRTENQP